MEKVCEFCMALRPAVFCQADSALLCLSCDSKVHSANALSNRHPRTLLCESCRARPASVRCEDHRMYTCRSCDRSLHSPGSRQHQKRAINSYIGCPSAKDFAALWYLDLNEVKDGSRPTQVVSSSHELGDASSDAFRQYYQQQRGGSSVGSVISCTNSSRAALPIPGMKKQRSHKISYKGQQQQLQQNQSSRFILQQVLDLKKLQLNEGNHYSPIMRGEVERDTYSSSGKALRRIDEDPDDNSQHSRDPEAEFLKGVSPLEEMRSEGFSSPFSSLENLPSSTAGASLLGDSFWQCRSPLNTSQFMSQNIQDLGVCEDLICRYDFNDIPDVDATFQSFEELFGGDQDPTQGLVTRDNDLSCSSEDREVWLDKSDHSSAPVMKDASASSSMYLASFNHVKSARSPSNRVGRSLRPSYSALSFSISQETDGVSSSSDSRAADMETKESAVTRCRDNKKARVDGEKAQHALLRDRSDARRRVKGGSGKSQAQNPDDMLARSY